MQAIIVNVPLSIRRRPGRKTLITSEGTVSAPSATIPKHADPATTKALARAFRWKSMLESGQVASISEIATKEKIDRGYVGTVLRLTLLAPDIVEMILDGRQPVELSLQRLLRPFPLEWGEQRRALGV